MRKRRRRARKDEGRLVSLRQENLARQQRVSEAGSATKSVTLDPARLHTSLADMPSQALFAWVCAPLGARGAGDGMCATNNCPIVSFMLL